MTLVRVVVHVRNKGDRHLVFEEQGYVMDVLSKYLIAESDVVFGVQHVSMPERVNWQ